MSACAVRSRRPPSSAIRACWCSRATATSRAMAAKSAPARRCCSSMVIRMTSFRYRRRCTPCRRWPRSRFRPNGMFRPVSATESMTKACARAAISLPAVSGPPAEVSSYDGLTACPASQSRHAPCRLWGAVAPRPCERGWRSLERARAKWWLARTRAQRRFSPTQLLSLVAVVVAGRHQGGLSRPREHRRAVRQGGAFAELRDDAPERRLAQDLREALDPPGVHTVQRVPARQVLLPVLRLARRPHLRSPDPAFARRPDRMGQCRRGLLALQSAQGFAHDGAGGHVSLANAVPAERAA